MNIGQRCKVLPHGPRRYVGQLGTIVSASAPDLIVKIDNGPDAWFQPSELEAFGGMRGTHNKNHKNNRLT